VIRAVYISKLMDGVGETIMILLIVLITGPIYDALAFFVLLLSAFYMAIKIKREIQQQFFNSVWKAFKSLFKKRNKYGENKKNE